MAILTVNIYVKIRYNKDEPVDAGDFWPVPDNPKYLSWPDIVDYTLMKYLILSLSETSWLPQKS